MISIMIQNTFQTSLKKEKFQFKLSDYIVSLQQIVKKRLNSELADGLVLKTQLDELSLLRLQQDKSALETWIEFKGSASIQIIVQ